MNNISIQKEGHTYKLEAKFKSGRYNNNAYVLTVESEAQNRHDCKNNALKKLSDLQQSFTNIEEEIKEF